ncbi:MAG: PucR family transcriptional regulator [Ruminococcaceae bacterium]|nr:PucR family transcriptional regulator [Oscillospiraceae bacterium]
MSNRLFQSVIHQMKEAIDRVLGIIDENGTVIACSELVRIGEDKKDIIEGIAYSMETYTHDGYTYRPIGTHAKLDYVIMVEGDDKTAYEIASVLAVSLNNIKILYDEKYDKSSFIKNIILDNILPSDIYIKAKELRFNSEIPRVVLFVRFQDSGDVMPYDIMQNMFPDKNKDYVISVGENDIVLVKEVKATCDSRELEKVANTIVDTTSTEFFQKVTVGIGTVAENIKDLARSFKEAQVAIEVGKVFDTEKNIINYENLGIGRLVYQLPTTLCEMFLQEVFKKGSLESLDQETLMTIQAFFENNLNVSETSRKLFVHRNTLVYRLEKIRKLTGLDLREFEHAITFKVALMVKKYLTSKPVKY